MALSGGADSCALLAAAARLHDAYPELPLRAVHVDHGLQSAAAQFRAACAAVCTELDVPLTVVAVEVGAARGQSIEAAAREARYAALERLLGAGECLLTAHHARDQAETLLLQTLRGAGLKGMSAMPQCRPFGSGWHVRPFLNTPREMLLAHGATLRAPVQEDPMNRDLRFERAWVRERLWPAVKARWPGADVALARAAHHAAEAQDLLDAAAAPDLARLRDGEALSLQGLRALPRPRRLNAVRLWLRECEVEPPSSARLQEALRQVLEARPEQMPVIVWGAHALRRYRQRLYLTAAVPARFEAALDWRIGADEPLALGPGLGSLHWQRFRGGIDDKHRGEAVRVRGRIGGERMRVAVRGRTHTLQHLCQAAGVLPWMRAALPLIAAGHALIGVGDLWLEPRWCAANELGFMPAWIDAPIIV